MVRDTVSAIVPAPCDEAFDVVHDYARRLAWDTLLRDAYVEGDGPAREGAVAVCTGKRSVGGLRIETVYVSFKRGVVAAVKMTNRPPFFDTWAASIRHERVDDASSRVTYTVSFTAKPRWLAWALEPVMRVVFRWETKRRLRALAAYLSRSPHA